MREKGISWAAPLFVVAPHTLCLAAKSSGKRAILWLIRPSNDHLRIRKEGQAESTSRAAKSLGFTGSQAIVFARRNAAKERRDQGG
jgi:hypothetical protein